MEPQIIGAIVGGTIAIVAQWMSASINAKNADKRQKEVLRPWLDIKITKTTIDDVTKKVFVVFQLQSVAGRSPACFVKCFSWPAPQGAASWGGGVTFASSVVLPGATIESEDYPTIKVLKFYDNVFTHGDNSEVKIICNYGMDKENEYVTEKTFVFNKTTQMYIEDPNRTKVL